jgi:hypothetical protein
MLGPEVIFWLGEREFDRRSRRPMSGMGFPPSAHYRSVSLPPSKPEGPWGRAVMFWKSKLALPLFPYLTNRLWPAYLLVRDTERLHGIVEDVMRLELRYRSDIDLSLPAMQVEIRSHIARCLRDYPRDGEGVITLGGVEHCFVYVVQDDVVHTVIGPPRTATPQARKSLYRAMQKLAIVGRKGAVLAHHRGWPVSNWKKNGNSASERLIEGPQEFRDIRSNRAAAPPTSDMNSRCFTHKSIGPL